MASQGGTAPSFSVETRAWRGLVARDGARGVPGNRDVAPRSGLVRRSHGLVTPRNTPAERDSLRRETRARAGRTPMRAGPTSLCIGPTTAFVGRTRQGRGGASVWVGRTRAWVGRTEEWARPTKARVGCTARGGDRRRGSRRPTRPWVRMTDEEARASTARVGATPPCPGGTRRRASSSGRTRRSYEGSRPLDEGMGGTARPMARCCPPVGRCHRRRGWSHVVRSSEFSRGAGRPGRDTRSRLHGIPRRRGRRRRRGPRRAWDVRRRTS